MDDLVVVRAQAGDERAYEELVRAHGTPLYRLCLGILGSEADAADATQDAFVAAWRMLPKLRDPSRFEAWLRQLAVNVCRMQLRRSRGVRTIQLTDPAVEPPNDPQDLGGLRTAFDQLSADHRAIIVLHHLEGRPLTEIAPVLGIPVGTVKSRLHAARRALAAELDREGA